MHKKGALEIRFNELGSTEVTEPQRCEFETGLYQGCPVQCSIYQLGAIKCRAIECRFREVASRKVGVPAITPGEIGLAKGDELQGRTEEANPVQILSRQIYRPALRDQLRNFFGGHRRHFPTPHSKEPEHIERRARVARVASP